MEYLYGFGLAVGLFAAGMATMFVIIHNNPNYIHVDDILKGKRDDVIDVLRRRLREKL